MEDPDEDWDQLILEAEAQPSASAPDFDPDELEALQDMEAELMNAPTPPPAAPKPVFGRKKKPVVQILDSDDEKMAEEDPPEQSRESVKRSFSEAGFEESGAAPKRAKLIVKEFLLDEAPVGDSISVRFGSDLKFLRIERAWEYEEKILKEKKRMNESKQELLQVSSRDLLAQIDESELESGEDVIADLDEMMNHEKLWVNKYGPQKFRDLLSNQKINRDACRWLKKWDPIVFKRIKKAQTVILPSKQRLQRFPRFASRQENQSPKKEYKSYYRRKKEEEALRDPMQGPEKKIMLFCGPPGTGKTTLAHVLAYHCGYEPVEINASDARTGKKLREKLESSLSMQALFSSRKPNLVILDEIDGIGGRGDNVAKTILSLVQGTKKKKPANRPIICICNDLYAKGLRTLREHCEVFKFSPPAEKDLISRLQKICRKERVHAEWKALHHLATLTDKDVRSCLHTLQFLRSRSKKKKSSHLATRITKDMLDAMPIGRKDFTHQLFDVWDVLIKDKKIKKREANSDKSEWDIILSMIRTQNAGTLVEGIIDNMYELPLPGTDHDQMKSLSELSDWISFSDEMLQEVQAHQRYEMNAYVNFAMLGMKKACATTCPRRVEYPRSNATMRRLRNENESIVNTFLHPENRAPKSFTFTPSATEIIPSLMHLLRPPLSHSSKDALLPNEEAMLKKVVQTMIAQDLDLVVPEFARTYDGAAKALEYNPPVNKLVEYSDPEVKGLYRFLPRPMQELVSQETKNERMKVQDAMERAAAEPMVIEEKVVEEKEELPKSKPPLPPLELKPKPMDVIPPSPDKKNPFGMIKRRSSEAMKRVVHDVDYMFVEGYTNSVKRKMRVSDFL